MFTYVYSERSYHLTLHLKVFKYSCLHLPKILHVKVTSLTTSYEKQKVCVSSSWAAYSLKSPSCQGPSRIIMYTWSTRTSKNRTQKLYTDISISFTLAPDKRYAQYTVNLPRKFLISSTLKIVLSYFQSQCTHILGPCALTTHNNKSMCSHDLLTFI